MVERICPDDTEVVIDSSGLSDDEFYQRVDRFVSTKSRSNNKKRPLIIPNSDIAEELAPSPFLEVKPLIY
ncbi:hypothetical protein A2696_01385 [Candidatus Curtissbacteria bacterium RIFCSPHIGHO2_01_FULL_41_13]|uniref:Uncharacterized protein n=1 Tax=Candidatus Curtissbacteria bacterium RIFCSPHIGHO2_01_FULL_41_13 TaxID=1797745 RepID=A0A1F5FY17_9BACT|nr:MAG: hypothetical protein A2696_01385 [Candidatus Curtissbacteria bacterium RIFCSPHIGHO2_01_FULL_41_13]